MQMLEIFDAMKIDPEKTEVVQFYFMKKHHREWFERLEELIKLPEKKFPQALEEMVGITPDQISAGVTFLLRGAMTYYVMDRKS